VPPELSVVIPTHDRRDLLRACLYSFEHQSASPETFEVVVVIDGSRDGTAEMLSAYTPPFAVSVLTQAQAGTAASRNAGAEAARGRVLLFVDDDMTASRSLVAAHLAAQRSTEGIVGVGVIQRRIPPGADRFAQLRAQASREHYEHLLVRPLTHLDCYGGNFSVSRSLFEEVEGFSVDLPMLNDYECAYRLHEAGARFVFVPDAEVTEERGDDWREIVADRERRGRIAVDLYRRDPAIVGQTELGGNEYLRRPWVLLRLLCLSLRVPPAPLVRVGFLLPRRSWARTWFTFVFSYAFWRGVVAAMGYRALWAALARRRRSTAGEDA
jgi:glycosyltransferase involved in cell wall biosynthesis